MPPSVVVSSIPTLLRCLRIHTMPTFSREHHFENDLRHLKQTERDQFRSALREFIDSLLQWENAGSPWPPPFPAALRIKDLSGYPGLWELSRTDGRVLRIDKSSGTHTEEVTRVVMIPIASLRPQA